jgi:hypothetical protein
LLISFLSTSIYTDTSVAAKWRLVPNEPRRVLARLRVGAALQIARTTTTELHERLAVVVDQSVGRGKERPTFVRRAAAFCGVSVCPVGDFWRFLVASYLDYLLPMELDEVCEASFVVSHDAFLGSFEGIEAEIAIGSHGKTGITAYRLVDQPIVVGLGGPVWEGAAVPLAVRVHSAHCIFVRTEAGSRLVVSIIAWEGQLPASS